LFEAELGNKLPELREREDYLTSCIFGSLKYLPPDGGLFPILNASFNYQLGTSLSAYLEHRNMQLSNFDKVRFHFWPRSRAFGEPDLVITLEGNLGSFLIPIEVKYFSGKHGEKDEDQLVRYYLALETKEGRETFSQHEIVNFSGNLLAFIYLTQFEAENEIEESVNILKSKGKIRAPEQFFHLRWQDVSKVIEKLMLKEKDTYRKAIYGDLRRLMEFKSLLPFRGFSEPHLKLSPELLLRFPVFFESLERRAQRFKHFAHLPDQLSPDSLSEFPVFLHFQSKKPIT
jgi:hypothetical protein